MTTTSTLPKFTLDQVSALCARHGVKELLIFGSFFTSRFDPETSDIDILVDFHDPDEPGIADRYLALAEGLEAAFGRSVDLQTRQAIRNPVFRQSVENNARRLYAA